MVLAVYASALAVLVILGLISVNEDLPENSKGKGLQSFFNRIASWLCRRIWSKRAPAGSLRVQMHLRTLYPGEDPASQLRAYYINKVSKLLMILTAGCLLSVLAWYNARQTELLDEEGYLIRADHGGGVRNAPLTASGETGEKLGDFDLSVSELRYTDDEIEELALQAMEELPGAILADNASLEEVRKGLDLVSGLPGYPFEIRWKVDNYECMHTDGSIPGELPEGGGMVVLTATLKYYDREWTQMLPVQVLPPVETREQKLHKAIEDKLTEAESENPWDERVRLPKQFGDLPVRWTVRIQDNSMILFLLTIFAAMMIYTAADRELVKQQNERQHQMMLDYPQFISRLVLYLGAGMTVRSIFYRLTEQYEEELAEGAKPRYLCEEIMRSCRELSGGISETVVYERFGIRCGAQTYVRLCTLLTQNLKRGNSELTVLLTEEAQKASQERMDYARRAGEEAGTKLLLPMGMLLAVVMVVIIIPAYMSFG